MFKVQEFNDYENYYVLTFTDESEAYGALIIREEEGIYLEFMEFEGDELISITEEDTPEEFQRLEEKYLNDILGVIE